MATESIVHDVHDEHMNMMSEQLLDQFATESRTPKELEKFYQILELVKIGMDRLDMDMSLLTELPKLSPYLILDGHRSGMKGGAEMQGYMEGAKFSLKFAAIFKMMGGRQSTFLIHTLRNYKTSGRMRSIFDAVKTYGVDFIRTAHNMDVRLRYYGKDVHTTYSLANLVNKAEHITKENYGFDLNFVTNYSERWGIENVDKLFTLPEINVVGRFTKGHYSGATLVTKQDAANFISIQQASISKNWSSSEIVMLILSLLKSYAGLKGFVGGKTYSDEEKEQIYQAREEDLWMGEYIMDLGGKSWKSITSYEPRGPVRVNFRV